MRIEIYFEDLSEAKQKELLKAAGIKEPKEANWDIFPITEVEYYEEESEEKEESNMKDEEEDFYDDYWDDRYYVGYSPFCFFLIFDNDAEVDWA